jgi:hypothetical protein
MERDGTAPPLPPDGKCDAGSNPLVDDCRGRMCDACELAQDKRTEAMLDAARDYEGEEA